MVDVHQGFIGKLISTGIACWGIGRFRNDFFFLFFLLRKPVFSLLVLFSLSPVVCAHSEDQVILDVTLNGQKLGQFFMWLADDGDVLVSADLFDGLRLKNDFFKEIAPEKISLKSLFPAVTYTLEADDAALTITVAPQWFESQLIQPPLQPVQSSMENRIKPDALSGFVNYRFATDYTEREGFQAYNLPWEIGFNWKKWFAFSNWRYRYNNGEDEHTRLMTQIIWDDPMNRKRLVLGDFAPPSTTFLGGNVMGGISWGSRFSLDRKFKPYPGLNADLVLETPARAELYSGGNLVKEWDLLPGPVRFEELNAYTGGSATLVLKDVFGRERRIDLPQLFGGRELLRKGIHEFSYNFGLLRKNFGTESFEYDDLSGSAYHRYGFSDWMTGGLTLAFQNDQFNGGPLLGFRLGSDHLIDSEAMASYRDGNAGYALSTQYTFRKGNFASGLSLLLYSRDFRPPFSTDDIDDEAIQSLRCQWNVTASHSWPRWGGLSLSYVNSDYRGNDEERTSLATLSYSKSLFKHFNLSFSIKQGIQGPDNREFFFSFQYTPVGDRQKKFYDHMAFRYREDEEKNRQEELSIQKYTGLGKGFGYSFNAIQSGQETGGSGRVAYRDELGIAEISLQQPPGSGISGNISWAGGIGIIDKGIYFGRPVIDSFAVVEVDGLESVPVYSGSNLAGETGINDTLMIPELISYNKNRVVIRPRDLPIDYELTGTERFVEIGQRGAAHIQFEAYRFTAVEGNLYKVSSDGGREYLSTLPLEFAVNGESRTSFTGQDGYFYLENLVSGEYNLRISYPGGVCNATIIVPESDAIVSNIGDVVCKPPGE